MSGYRTRGLLRAAALLAVGTSPLLASAASAAEGPTEIVDGTIAKIGNAPEVGLDATKPVTDLLSGQAVKLPAPLPGGTSDVTAPTVATPAALQAPAAPALPFVGDLLAPQARALPALPELPVKPPVSGPSEMPDLAGELGKLPVPMPLG
ncbi:hypothetical protein IOD16_21480 [Saccharothrix sp. 6-C]|uniref:hypothetical protein n=1 Tax=Saccharothrix sp. 6-C TaxID=2781735 RepID=UPI0019170EFE|nr:hypothetical protein [Saccharothrix sp. 6-C]QQQ73823.1 hypothetical protein IOD16_21480 [Saccharothrix sp. 6-C]